jgi:IMP dehydrogenase
MKNKIKRSSLTYDDVLLEPKYSDISSRSHISLNTKVSRRYGLLTPYVASCMDTVCESEMAIKMAELGGVGCIHRFMTIEEQCEEVRKVRNYFRDKTLYEEWGVMYDNWHTEIQDIPVMASVGVMSSDIDRAIKLVDAGVNILIIDVAHGHHSNVKNMISELKKCLPTHVDIIAGNISTARSAMDLREWGADGLRVGIGGGSLCTTRIKTGHGVPNITSILDCVIDSDIPVMADGGIRNSGDISKALGVGASCVMLGSLLAGTKESPGNIVERGNGSLYKKYRGSASLETKSTHGQATKHIEGESTLIPFKGGVSYIIESLNDGVKSALSYSGCRTIAEFNEKATFVEITNSGMVESKAHLL